MSSPITPEFTATRVTLQLLNNYSTRLELSYSHSQKAARVGYGKHRRLFFIESNGTHYPRYNFKNEYGLEVGSLQFDGKENGSLCMRETKHDFIYEYSTIVLYNESGTERRITCNLKTLQMTAVHDPCELENVHACLLFALGWSFEVQQP